MQKRILLLITALLLATAAALPASPAWEPVEVAIAVSDADPDADKVQALAKDGYIYVYSPRPVTVRVLTILGQQISQQKLPAGWSRLKPAARGFYIVKAGDATLRVTI